jgi:hypothetical protein
VITLTASRTSSACLTPPVDGGQSVHPGHFVDGERAELLTSLVCGAPNN